MNRWDVLTVGGGAAGMMAAGTAAGRGLSVLLVEKNPRPGRKLMITGKGRCNVTNRCGADTVIANTPTNGRFLYSAVSRFTPEDTMRFFEGLGVPLKVERGDRVFPQSDKAVDIVDALADYVKRQGAQLMLQSPVDSLLLSGGRVGGVVLRDGRELCADSVVVACGGASYPGTGSTGDGYALASQAGHTVIMPRPALAPLSCRDEECRELQGLTLKNVAVSVEDTEKRKELYRDFGELLFTHFGLSGPVILSAASHMRSMAPGRYVIKLDLKPALSPERLDARLQRELERNKNRDFSNSLGELLPRKLIPVVVRRSGIPGELKCNSVTRAQRQALGALLKCFTVTVEDFRPLEEAIVTSGGVCVKEVDPKTMESRLVKGLYFAGEVLDVDAYTGGFNLQIAFSTGRLAGIACSTH